MQIPYWDVEDICDEIVDALKDGTSGLNAAIAAVNTYKSAKDTARSRVVMTMDKFKDTAGNETLKENENLFFDFVEEITNCDPVMVIKIPVWDETSGETTQTISFEIIIEDNSDGTDPKRKLKRYLLALRAVLKDYFDDATKFTASKLRNVEPKFQPVDESRSFYSAGVSIEIDYA